jgi:hypothetical protein
VRIAVVDLKGQTLWSRVVEPAEHGQTLIWDGSVAGHKLARGVFVARMLLLEAKGRQTPLLQRKVLLVR